MGLLSFVVVVAFLFCFGGFLVGDEDGCLWFKLVSNVDDDFIFLILCKEPKRKKKKNIQSVRSLVLA